MPVRRSVTISLSPELLAVAERLIEAGRYGNVSEVMRTALRLLEERELDFQAHRDIRMAMPAAVPASIDLERSLTA